MSAQPQTNLMTQNDRDALERQIFSMREDLTDIKGSMSKVADALTTLAVLEERHQTVATATNKILSRIEKMEERQIDMDRREFALTEIVRRVEVSEVKVATLEAEKNVQDGKIKGIMVTVKVLWAVIGGGVSAVILGLSA